LKTLIDASGIERNTANAYDAMLERLLITERLPAWSSNRLNRLIRLPKRYLIDPAFVGPLLGVDARAVLRDGDRDAGGDLLADLLLHYRVEL